MALTNFTLPFGIGVPLNNWSSPTLSPIQQPHQATAVNNLLYGPESDDGQYYKNIPYAPPAQPAVSYQQQRQQYHQRQNHYYQYRSRNNYLPPPSPPKLASPSLLPSMQPPQHQVPNSQAIDFQSQTISSNFQQQNVRTYQQSQNGYSNNDDNFSDTHINSNSESTDDDIISQSIASRSKADDTNATENDHDHSMQPPLLSDNQPTFTHVTAGQGSKTQVHAILDYDNDEQFDEKQITGNSA